MKEPISPMMAGVYVFAAIFIPIVGAICIALRLSGH